MAKKKASAFGALTRELIEKTTGYRPLTKKEAQKLGVAERNYIKIGAKVKKGVTIRSRRSVEQETIQAQEYTKKRSGLLERKRKENVLTFQGGRKVQHSISDQAKAYIKAHPEEVKALRTKSGKISIRKVQASAGFKGIRAEFKKVSKQYDKHPTKRNGQRVLELLYDIYGDESFKDQLLQKYGVTYG
jgi:hypothetical protein